MINYPRETVKLFSYGRRCRRRVGLEPTLRRFRAETTVLKTAGASRPGRVRRPTLRSSDDAAAEEVNVFPRIKRNRAARVALRAAVDKRRLNLMAW
jgi:hypothetical protein